MLWANVIIFALAGFLLVPVVVLCVECLAALLPGRRCQAAPGQGRPLLAVLIPAHNEEAMLGQTLETLLPQLSPDDRVIVIADNCNDATAAVARDFAAHGFNVTAIDRHDARRRGKGYALDFGLRYLENDQKQRHPDVVLMMDADCSVDDGAMNALAAQVVATGRPAQAVYLMEKPGRARAKDLVSALAFLVKNLVRPRGLARLKLPCLLTGTGMAFPWKALCGAKLASANIVEDLQLGIDLAVLGHPPLFCPAARVTGRLPQQTKAALAQRTRWEHGHLQTLLTQVPRLLNAGLKQRRFGLVALALELFVPPLSLLVMTVLVATGLLALAGWLLPKLGGAFAGTFNGPRLAAQILAAAVAAAGVCIFAAWGRFGRKSLPLTSLLAAPFYMAWKVPLYFGFFARRQIEWVRTDRSDSADDSADRTPDELDEQFEGHEEAVAAGAPHGRPGAAEGELPADAPRVELGGVALHAVTEKQCARHILGRLKEGEGGVVATPNLDHLRHFKSDPEYARWLRSADLVVADALPLLWASRLQGTPLPARVGGPGLIARLCAAAARRGYSVFLLGGEAGMLDSASASLRRQYPSLRIVGAWAGVASTASKTREDDAAGRGNNPPTPALDSDAPRGASGESIDSDESIESTDCVGSIDAPALARALYQAQPDVVFIVGSSPRLERRHWGVIRGLRRRLPGTWWLGIGTSFRALTGDVRPAPEWMSRNGLGWAHRLYQHPERVGRRYLIDGLPSTLSLLCGAALRGLARRLSGRAAPRPADLPAAGPTPPAPALAGQNQPARLGDLDAGAAVGDGPRMVYRSFVTGLAAGLAETGDGAARAGYPVAAIPSAVPAEPAGGPPRTPDVAGLRRLRAVVLLGGSLRASRLGAAARRPVLDLPLEFTPTHAGENQYGATLLSHWREQVIGLRRSVGLDALDLRVRVDRQSPLPAAPGDRDGVRVRVERDAADFRGTGGVLRDLADAYADDDLLLVATAAQVLLEPLAVLAGELAASNRPPGGGRPHAAGEAEGPAGHDAGHGAGEAAPGGPGADVSLISHADGTPCGLMLVRCAALRGIAPGGYVDFKEQALPVIAGRFRVADVRHRSPAALPLRTFEEYLAALRGLHVLRHSPPPAADPFAEDRRAGFAVIEAGARVHPNADLHDAAVLAGGRVEAGATLVRSLVCPGAQVRRGEVVIDRLVTAPAPGRPGRALLSWRAEAKSRAPAPTPDAGPDDHATGERLAVGPAGSAVS